MRQRQFQIRQRTLTMFVGVVALRCQHHMDTDNGEPQLSQT